jgi:hypothetical protein
MARTIATKTIAPRFSFAQELAFMENEMARIASTRTSSPKASIAQPVDAEYEQWKHEMGLDIPMTESQAREMQHRMFNPCDIC